MKKFIQQKIKVILLLAFLLIFIAAIRVAVPDGGHTETFVSRTAPLDLCRTEVVYAGGAGTGNPKTTAITDNSEGWQWFPAGDEARGYASATLVLDGFQLTTEADKALIIPDGTTMIIKNDNRIISTFHDGSSSAVFAAGSLTISGTPEDRLMLRGGDLTGKYTITSFGLQVAGDFTVTGGIIEAASGTGTISKALSVSGDITVSGGDVYCRGGDAANISVGIWLVSTGAALRITGGRLTALGGTAEAGSSYGIYGEVCDIGMTGGALQAEAGSGGLGSYGVHILIGSSFVYSGRTMILAGHGAAINMNPYMTEPYQYRSAKTTAPEFGEEWESGRIDHFPAYKYIEVKSELT